MRVSTPRAAEFSQRFRTFDSMELTDDTRSRRYRAASSNGAASGFAFANPDFNVRELNAKAVMRWQFRRGSNLYLVWSQAREKLRGRL